MRGWDQAERMESGYRAPPTTHAGLLDAAGLAPRFRTKSEDADHVHEVDSRSITPETLREEFVLRNVPVVIRGAVAEWPPCRLWDEEHLRRSGEGQRVSCRRSDSDGRFGDPEREGCYRAVELDWESLLSSMAEAESQGSVAPYYAAQLRLRSLPALHADARPVPAWISALGALWRNAPSIYIGCGARTPLHFDLLENFFCVVRGRKRMTLWHPSHSECLYPGGGGSALFSRVRLDAVDATRFPRFEAAAGHSHSVELSAGDALYLPCGWWHAVSTPPGERSISVSYWAQQPETKAWAPPESESSGEDGGGFCVTR